MKPVSSGLEKVAGKAVTKGSIPRAASLGNGKKTFSVKQATILLDIQVPPEAECLAQTRRAMKRVAEQMHLQDEAAGDLLLAVGEACNNAIAYGAKASPIRVRCGLSDCGRDGQILQVDIANLGNSFLPRKNDARFSMPRPQALAGHGRGLALMRILMDDVEVFCQDGSTVVRLTKRIN